MPKSNRKLNAFYFFMVDWKKQEERKGCFFPNGLRDVQSNQRCHNTWKNLSNEDKAYYKEKEKNYKIKTNKDKKTSFGESVAQLEQNKRTEKEFFECTKEYVTSLIYEAKKNKTIQKLKFFVIHINYFYCRIMDNNEMDCAPAEISIGEFCLENGITRVYHKIVRSKIEMGYAYEASEHSKHTHQIPKDVEFGEENYSLIYEQICDFLHSDRLNGKYPILFTCYEVESIKYPVINILQKLSNFNYTCHKHFTIFSFEELFVSLYNIISEENTETIKFDKSIASIRLKNDPFDYKKSIQCEFHKQTLGGGNYCSKSLVQRWIFVLLSDTCKLLQIALHPGSHTPLENTNEKQSFELNNAFLNLSLETSALELPTSTKKSTKKEEKHTSERMHREEQLRQLESMAKPFIIIDHSLINETHQNRSHITEPKGSECLPIAMSPLNAFINSDEDAFPSLGRGHRNKERKHLQKPAPIASGLPENSFINFLADDNFPSLGRGKKNH